MSYCRWSSDNSKCDFYIYEDVNGGWTTHLAGRRRIGIPDDLVDPLTLLNSDDFDNDEWLKLYKEHHEILEACSFEEIEHPLAGETFNDATLEELKSRLVYLMAEGFYAPDYVLEIIDEEIKEQNDE